MLTFPLVLLLSPIPRGVGHTIYECRDGQMKQLPPETLRDETTNNFFPHLQSLPIQRVYQQAVACSLPVTKVVQYKDQEEVLKQINQPF